MPSVASESMLNSPLLRHVKDHHVRLSEGILSFYYTMSEPRLRREI